MREIKFRAWDRNKNRMYYEGDAAMWSKDKPITSGDLLEWFEDGDLMQFTGLKDKNGKEIWEGDIVRSLNENWEVQFSKGQFEIKAKRNSFGPKSVDFDMVEVIGNIYENPELLKPKE